MFVCLTDKEEAAILCALRGLALLVGQKSSEKGDMRHITAFDYMLEQGLTEYRCDPWMHEVHANNYRDLAGVCSGQVDYCGYVFVVHRAGGSRGMGGMDEGSPASASITRVVLPAVRGA